MTNLKLNFKCTQSNILINVRYVRSRVAKQARNTFFYFFIWSHCKYKLAFDEKEKACRRTESKIKKKCFVKKKKLLRTNFQTFLFRYWAAWALVPRLPRGRPPTSVPQLAPVSTVTPVWPRSSQSRGSLSTGGTSSGMLHIRQAFVIALIKKFILGTHQNINCNFF